MGESVDPDAVLGALRMVVEEAAVDPVLGDRLARARTSVELTTAGRPRAAICLCLDRRPVEVVDAGPGVGAEARLEMDAGILHRVCSGELPLAVAIADGSASYSGCIRKFLRVSPILRSLAPMYAAALAGAVTEDTV